VRHQAAGVRREEEDITFKEKIMATKTYKAAFIGKLVFLFLGIYSGFISLAQDFKVTSPDHNIVFNVSNSEKLTYSITFNGQPVINSSQLGFEFKNEPPKMSLRCQAASLCWINQLNLLMKHGSLL